MVDRAPVGHYLGPMTTTTTQELTMDTTAPDFTRSFCCQESISRPGHSGPWSCDNCHKEQTHALRTAAGLARATGSSSVTYREERREADGSLTVTAETSAARMCPCGILAAAPGDRYCEPCRDGVNNQ